MSQEDQSDISVPSDLSAAEELNILISQRGPEVTKPPGGNDGISLRLLTHNIRYATANPFPGEELWTVRRRLLCSELHFHSASVPETFICLQEVLHIQIVDILSSLNEGDDWAYCGVGRDDGKEAGEYSPIFYRPSVWKLKTWRTVWLSETPEKAGSKGWDASSVRIVTIGIFRHAKTDQPVIIMSTHFDDQGYISRRESAKMILSLVAEYQNSSDWKGSIPILLAGDFNSTTDGDAYKIVTAPSSTMVDLRELVPAEKRYGNELTFTSFGTIDDVPSRIDFLFSNKQRHCVPRTYAVLPNRFDDGVYLSDHRAVVADLMLLPPENFIALGIE